MKRLEETYIGTTLDEIDAQQYETEIIYESIDPYYKDFEETYYETEIIYEG